MKKFLLLAAFVTIAATTATAQIGDKYQWEIDLGYTIGFKDTYGRINMRTVHGFRFNDYFFAGAGTGLDIYHGVPYTKSGTAGTRGQLAIPLYLNAKGYIPVAEQLKLMVGMDFGYSIGIVGKKDNSAGSTLGGILVMPEVGIGYEFYSGKMLTFGIGYSINSIKAYVKTDKTTTLSPRDSNNGFSMRFGFVF